MKKLLLCLFVLSGVSAIAGIIQIEKKYQPKAKAFRSIANRSTVMNCELYEGKIHAEHGYRYSETITLEKEINCKGNCLNFSNTIVKGRIKTSKTRARLELTVLDQKIYLAAETDITKGTFEIVEQEFTIEGRELSLMCTKR